MRERTSSAVEGWVDIPGPIIRASFPSRSSRILSKASEERVPLSVSGSGSVINSTMDRAMMGRQLFGVPTVTKPAPIFRAALAAIAAAPVLPIDPERIKRCP